MSEIGKFYVYRDEDKNAVAVAKWVKGPSGGMMGQTFCRMGVPYGKTTQEDINNRAEFIVKACNAYADIVAKDAENAKLREALDNARRAAVEDTLGALTAHELYQYRPKAFEGFIAYARAKLTGGSNVPA